MKSLRTDSLVMKVAYGFTPKSEIPERISLCRLFRRVVLMTLFAWPSAFFAVIVIGGIAWTIGLLVFGQQPNFGLGNRVFKPISWWPKIKGQSIPLGLVLIVITGIYMSPSLATKYTAIVGDELFLTELKNVFFGLGTIFLIVALIVSTVIATMKIKKTETWQLFIEYLKAKMAGVCPIYEIEKVHQQQPQQED